MIPVFAGEPRHRERAAPKRAVGFGWFIRSIHRMMGRKEDPLMRWRAIACLLVLSGTITWLGSPWLFRRGSLDQASVAAERLPPQEPAPRRLAPLDRVPLDLAKFTAPPELL